MAVHERWLQGRVFDNPGNEQIDLELVLSGLLNALIEEQKLESSSGAIVPPDPVKIAEARKESRTEASHE
jgi:hypothetical protein